MEESRIHRINELYHKSQKEGLTLEEKEEQTRLRAEYVAAVRANLRGTLNNVSIVEPDGSITELAKQKKEHLN
ncbi:MAG: DUF896 domain-containing protein [Lachnospiraceae bacterium]|nr:DUF896 domain-containing protein [Lachnospiraceae bacterium]